MAKIRIKLAALERKNAKKISIGHTTMEFHINREIRREHGLKGSLFSLTGNVVLADMRQTRELAAKLNVKAGQLYAMGLIDEILHYVTALYRQQVQPDLFNQCLENLNSRLGENRTGALLIAFSEQFPPEKVYSGEKVVPEYLQSYEEGENCSALTLEETIMLHLANLNPAFKPFKFLFDDKELAHQTVYPAAIEEIKFFLKELPPFGPEGQNLWDMLRAPALASDTLSGQLEYMRKHWGLLIGKFASRLLIGLDVIKEEEKPYFPGPGPSAVMNFAGLDEYERFSPDQEWMPNTVLMAKSTLVWLFQLSQKYGRNITRLDQIPDEELDELARRGFTGLWLIGLWERSNASKTIKQWTGNPEAAASAYSLYDYDIANELGGWDALSNLRDRCIRRGIRLGSDMVPNHTGIDSRWMIEHPDRFLQLSYPPFPTYTYNCENLSGRNDITVQIEDHYFSRNDAAVVLKRINNHTGETRYIYHGNDGTSMPWNDTAQIDFLNPEAREAVIRTIIGVCQQFSIVRFDAAMTLAKRHIQRLWYPVPGHGGDIPSRAEHSISNEEFNRRIPNEFWREVVDRCAAEAPHTLLLAEAFWMMEGYFVRTLGMHRVYNSAFMNMLKNEENSKYRLTIKNTLEFDPEILKRFVNFMNNPDEDTAVAQFGKGDKYFGICTLLVTMPGLPMFGHGQIEGFEEKYGMEYRRSYRDEQPDNYFVERHEKEIFPLMKRRALFSGSSEFTLYDLFTENGFVNENVFAFSNKAWINSNEERTLVFYNNSYNETAGWIKNSDPAIPVPDGAGKKRRNSLHKALSLHREDTWFTLLRDQRSNLWYIRSSKAIYENGFFAVLKGYEAQVFIDIYEVKDDERGRWARLHNDLNGAAVKDPELAIMDIYLGELYYRFTKMLDANIISQLHGFFAAEAVEKAQKEEFIESLKENAETYFETAKYFMDGADGKFDAWGLGARDQGLGTRECCSNISDTTELNSGTTNIFHSLPPVSDDTPQPPAPSPQPLNSSLLWHEFRAYIERLIGLADYTNAQGKTPKDLLFKKLTKQLKESPLACAGALAYGLLAVMRSLIGQINCSEQGESGSHAADLAFRHWNLDRKLMEQFHNFGSEDAAWNLAEIIKAVLCRTASGKTTEGQFDAKLFAKNIIENNYLQDDFRNLIGINYFNDVTWFNKEAFENTLFYTTLFLVLENDNAFYPCLLSYTKRVDHIAEIFQAIEKTEKDSGYMLDKLLNNLADKKQSSERRKK